MDDAERIIGRLWEIYVGARRLAEKTADIDDGIYAARAYAEWRRTADSYPDKLAEFVPHPLGPLHISKIAQRLACRIEAQMDRAG